MSTINTYTAKNAVTGQSVQFQYRDHSNVVVDPKTKREIAKTVRQSAEQAMQQAHGTSKVHCWSVDEKPGSDFFAMQAKRMATNLAA